MRISVFDGPAGMKRKYLAAAVVKDASLGPRQIRVIVSTPTPDRVKDVMEPSGFDVENYRKNPIVLADHDRKSPIGTAEIEIKSDRVEAVITFAEEGASQKADEYCALAKSGVLNTVSPGFLEREATPIKGGGVHVIRCELLELSLVSIPCNPEATVIAREYPGGAAKNWKVGASLNLLIDASGDWAAAAAEKSIFDKAEFGDGAPDKSFARKGFLLYDAAAPMEKDAYRLPFAKVVDGRLTAVAGGLRAAAAGLAQANLPDDVKEKARAVIAHYEAQMKSSLPAKVKALFAARRKDMCDVSQLSYVLQSLISLAVGADWEREYENDDSALPEMLAEIARAAGEALLAMTAEETAEALARLEGLLPAGEKTFVDAGPTPVAKLLRAASIRAKAGRMFSSDNEKCIGDAMSKMMEAHGLLDGMMKASAGAADDDDGDEKAAPQSKSSDAATERRRREIEILGLKRA